MFQVGDQVVYNDSDGWLRPLFVDPGDVGVVYDDKHDCPWGGCCIPGSEKYWVLFREYKEEVGVEHRCLIPCQCLSLAYAGVKWEDLLCLK